MVEKNLQSPLRTEYFELRKRKIFRCVRKNLGVRGDFAEREENL